MPTISGTAQAGQTLTADTSGIADGDGLTNVTFSYQWLADDIDVQGATGSTYTLTDDDVGQTISVRVTFTDNAEENLSGDGCRPVPTAQPRVCPPSAGRPRRARRSRRMFRG